MKDVYRKVNERTVKKMAKRIMKHPKSEYQKAVRNGVLALGGDIEYLENVIKDEISFINNSTFEKISEYNPRKFQKSMKTNNWIKDGLKVLPNSMFEHAYIGKYLLDYIDEGKRFDVVELRKISENIECEFREDQLNLCKRFRKKHSEEEPNLIQENELQQFFENSKAVYICNDTKAIFVIYEFKEFLYDVESAVVRFDSWHYNPKYYIRNEEVLKKQVKKIKNLEKELKIPSKEQIKEFIFWLNGTVTYEEVVEYMNLISSINLESKENMRYCSENIKKAYSDGKYQDYMLYGLFSTIDPFSQNMYNNCVKYEKISYDYLNDEKYQEIYE